MVSRRPRPTTLAVAVACTVALMLLAIAVAPVAASARPSPVTASASAAAAVPAGFVGMNVGGPLSPTSAGVNLSNQLGTMVTSGVDTIRAVFDWSYAQPYSSWSQVPSADRSQFANVGGVPTRFAQIDELVQQAAEHGLTVLPTIIYAPSWDAHAVPGVQLEIPKRPAPYAAFCAALVRRYGPRGTFWKTHSPAVPIRMWQIWNEPNLSYYWPQPFATSYVALLRAAHNSIKAANRSAKVVLAGLPDFSWESLKAIYHVRGASRLFDVVALHPYTKQPQGVITILGLVRQVILGAHDASKPMIADEVSWPSSVGHHATGAFDIGTTEAGQAKKIATLLPLLAEHRRSLNLIGFDYYTWATPDDNGANQFDFAGLFKYSSHGFTAKPAYAAFRKAALAIEHCRKRGRLAGSCARPS